MAPEPKLGALEQVRARFLEIAREARLLDTPVEVLAKPLTAEEAIGTPGRRDFPIQAGKERILEATFRGARGHAFTDSAREFLGSLAEVLALPLETNSRRAVLVATLNAALAHLGRARGTVHCKDDEPERCGAEIASQLRARHGAIDVGMIGLNPAIAEHLARAFGAARVRVADLCPTNIGQRRFEVEIWDGASRAAELIQRSDVVLITGTTLQNGTFDALWAEVQARGKRGLLYGVTAAGVCALTGIERICPCGRQG